MELPAWFLVPWDRRRARRRAAPPAARPPLPGGNHTAALSPAADAPAGTEHRFLPPRDALVLPIPAPQRRSDGRSRTFPLLGISQPPAWVDRFANGTQPPCSRRVQLPKGTPDHC